MIRQDLSSWRPASISPFLAVLSWKNATVVPLLSDRQVLIAEYGRRMEIEVSTNHPSLILVNALCDFLSFYQNDPIETKARILPFFFSFFFLFLDNALTSFAFRLEEKMLPRHLRHFVPSAAGFLLFPRNCRRNDIIARCRDQSPSTSSFHRRCILLCTLSNLSQQMYLRGTDVPPNGSLRPHDTFNCLLNVCSSYSITVSLRSLRQ